MKDKLAYIKRMMLDGNDIWNILNDSKYKKNRIEAELIRNVHSIEKGLSLENPRKGFGYAKICELFSLVDEYIELGGLFSDDVLLMAKDALSEYIRFHNDCDYHDDNIDEVVRKFENIFGKECSLKSSIYGGVLHVKNEYSPGDEKIFEKIVFSRHSVREFSGDTVPLTAIYDAIRIASRCPSACNRQGYHAYILEKENFDMLEGWLDGVGGFADDADKFILVTGRISTYKPSEKYQWIVSATVFASNLVLALHAKGFGACYVQRSVTPNKKWNVIRQRFNISGDEQAVCMIAVGCLKDEFRVPVSYRLPEDKICSIIKK